MSHITKIDIEIYDLIALSKAADSIGMELVEQATFKWWGHVVGDFPLPDGFTKDDMGKCDHVLRVKGNREAYEVGVCKSRTGKGYILLWDFFAGGRGLRNVIGTKGVTLTNSYTEQAAIRKMRQKGYGQSRRKVLEDGTVQLIWQ